MEVISEIAWLYRTLTSMLKFVMVSRTEKAVSFRDNFDGASRSRDLVQIKISGLKFWRVESSPFVSE